ncbi:MAG: CRISPR-associated endonuclease Cas1, partial [Gammaproteobacteria bacterium]
MRFVESSNPGFFHHAALASWLRTILDGPEDFDLALGLEAPQQGQTRFPAGSDYFFRVVGIGDRGRELIASIPDATRQARAWDAPMPFRNNWKFEAMETWMGGEPVSGPEVVLDAQELACQRAWLASRREVILRFVSPWRVLRPKEQRGRAKGDARYCRDAADLAADALWLRRIADSLISLIERRGGKPPQLPDPGSPDATLDLFWANYAYRKGDGRSQPMGGLMGEIRLRHPGSLAPAWLDMLVLAQFLAVGQRRAFGNGAFRILDECGEALLPVEGMGGWLERAMEEENLLAAWRGIAGESSGEAEDEAEEEIAGSEAEPWDADSMRSLAGRLLRGEYTPPPMHGFVHEDADGGLRPLAAAPLRDRVLQRAVHQQLSPALDTLMNAASFGYRTGRSRHRARDLIQSLYREGYRWVFESDIRHFFDSVDWERLRVRLDALLRDERLTRAVLAWMRAPVLYQGRRIVRERGLPQGSPLSPLLANLMLDDFDHDLTDAGCRLVRFADDFVIVAKSRAAAERAGELARRALVDLGLALNEEKTRIVPFAEGFRFLGFVFVNGLAVEAAPRRADDAGRIPEQSWLARVVHEQKDARAQSLEAGEPVGFGHFEDAGQMLVFCGEPSVVMTREGRVCIERDDARLHEVPWSHLDGMVLFGRHHLTTPAIHAALNAGVPIHLASSFGHYRGMIAGPDKAARTDLWMRQHELAADEARALPAARSLVESRIRHMRETLRRREGVAVESLSEMDRLLARLPSCASREELNGIEGTAARGYFGEIRRQLDPGWGFEGRRRRPAPDPFNALLSLGYTLLYAHVDTLLRADGLLPEIGFYHRPRSGHAALASDLM